MRIRLTVVVVSLSLAFIGINFLDVESFSTTAPLSLSSRRTPSFGKCDDTVTNAFRIIPGISEVDRTRHTKTSSQKSNNLEKNNKKKNNNKYKDRQEQQQRERQRRELQNKLHRARDSILYFGQDNSNELPSIELRSGILPEIVRSYTTAIFASEATANLFDPWDCKKVILEQSRGVQERVLGLLAVLMQVITHIEEEYALLQRSEKEKSYVTKTTIDDLSFVQSRLWETSREVLRDMAYNEKPHVVSPMAITALAKSLRESKTRVSTNVGREEIQELMQLVEDARQKARHKNDEALDMAMASAWNIYLGSLCDKALATNNPADTGMETAAELVMQKTAGIVESNIISYNTVMSVAAKIGNATLVDTLWKDLIKRREEQDSDSLQPNSRTYNTRLMVTNDDTKRLRILDKEIIPSAFQLQRENSNISASPKSFAVIDSFTIDMMMMPLLKANRKKHLFQLIDHWMTLVNRQHNIGEDHKQRKLSNNKAQRAFKNAMAAFFITLVQKNGDVRMARELWNRYMVLSIENTNKNSNMNTDAFLRATNIVTPERRHYNILLDGYARLVDQVRDRQAREQLRIPDDNTCFDGEKNKKVKIWEAATDSNNKKEECDVTTTSEFYEKVQEKAIHDGQELFALMIAEQQQQQNSRNKVGPDAYTKSTMIRLCRSGLEVQNLLQKTSAASNKNTERTWLPRAVTRAAITTCGRLGDPSMSCLIFDQFMFPDFDASAQNHFSNYRAFNVLLGALAAGAKLDNPRLGLIPSDSQPSSLLSALHGLTCTEAVVRILNLMTKKNSQTYCVAASALQYSPIDERILLASNATNIDQNNTITAANSDAQEATPLAFQIFQNATRDGIHADGRLVNAIFRCYGDNIAGALDGWKSDIRQATYEFEQKVNGKGEGNNKNMLAAYNGLLYVCGRAERPDIAVRIVYAMKNKEGLDPSENPYNNYRSGKLTRKSLVKRDKKVSRWRGMLPKLDLVGQYENVLYVECKKYDTRDRRTEKDSRIRIIV